MMTTPVPADQPLEWTDGPVEDEMREAGWELLRERVEITLDLPAGETDPR